MGNLVERRKAFGQSVRIRPMQFIWCDSSDSLGLQRVDELHSKVVGKVKAVSPAITQWKNQSAAAIIKSFILFKTFPFHLFFYSTLYPTIFLDSVFRSNTVWKLIFSNL